jgi:hypothetical protein
MSTPEAAQQGSESLKEAEQWLKAYIGDPANQPVDVTNTTFTYLQSEVNARRQALEVITRRDKLNAEFAKCRGNVCC